jgi:hypothetical protein
MVRYKTECVEIAANYTNSAYICNKFTKNFGPTLLRNFLLKKSNFLGIFKNILIGFYFNCHIWVNIITC